MGVLTGRDKEHLCPVTRAGLLDSRVRRWLQDPHRILQPFVRPGMTVLDIGCGVGFFSLELAGLVGACGRVIAVDLQAGMLDLLQAKVRGAGLEKVVSTLKCEVDSLCLDSSHPAADFALAFFVAHEVPDKARFFREVYAAMAPGGRFLVVEPKFHVSQKAFDAEVNSAVEAGFQLQGEPPKVFFSLSVLLGKG